MVDPNPCSKITGYNNWIGFEDVAQLSVAQFGPRTESTGQALGGPNSGTHQGQMSLWAGW